MVKRLLVVAVMVGMLASCTGEAKVVEEQGPDYGRIILKESRVIRGSEYLILEVDGVEFLTSSKGGLTRL